MDSDLSIVDEDGDELQVPFIMNGFTICQRPCQCLFLSAPANPFPFSTHDPDPDPSTEQ